eukprot:1152143-Prorocentrum_minimum.AAC.3
MTWYLIYIDDVCLPKHDATSHIDDSPSLPPGSPTARGRVAFLRRATVHRFCGIDIIASHTITAIFRLTELASLGVLRGHPPRPYGAKLPDPLVLAPEQPTSGTIGVAATVNNNWRTSKTIRRFDDGCLRSVRGVRLLMVRVGLLRSTGGGAFRLLPTGTPDLHHQVRNS